MHQRLICTTYGTQLNTDFDMDVNCLICDVDRQKFQKLVKAGPLWKH
jgi:hypothetical protein